MQDFLRMSIDDAVKQINNQIFLPDIQRDFVWKPLQAYTLFDSIMRDYPINTMLFWQISGAVLKNNKIKKFEFVRTDKEKNIENKDIVSDKIYNLVLDGQQRLTTFYLVLKGNYITRNNPYDLYFNVLSGSKEDDNGNLFEFKLWNESKGDHFKEISNDNQIKIWYRLKTLCDIKDLEDVQYIIVPSLEKEYDFQFAIDNRKALSKLARLLKYEKIVYYYPEIENDYDKVLDIFVRTNRGGTILTYSDLLFSNVKLLWNDARSEFDKLIATLNMNDRYCFSRDFILKTILLLYAKDWDGVKYRTKNLTEGLLIKIKGDNDKNGDWYTKISPAISLVADMVRDKFLLSHDKLILSYNALIPLIYWVFKNNLKGIGNERNCITDTELSNMRIWLIKALLSGTFGGQTDNVLFNCKMAIDNANTTNFPAIEIEKQIKGNTNRDITVDWKNLFDTTTYSSVKSYLLLSIIYRNTVNFAPVMDGNLPEQDHIFSKDELRSANISEDKINCMYNIRFLESTSNKVKGCKEIAQWFSTVQETELNRHSIPKGNWTIGNYDSFLNTRETQILKDIETLTYVVNN